MAIPKAAWGIEIGAYAIKAIRLERAGDEVSVSDFTVIPHKKVLTTPDLDQDEMVRLGLGQFISQKTLEGEHLVLSVPGHSAFARFAKLPPVEPKKVPDIVKFEAVQQIPFPIDQVEWDYQTFTSEDSPEIEVGIFAITRERVQQRLGLYAELGVTPEAMTLSPVAVYNAMAYDHDLLKRRDPVVYIDIGTSATDVVIAEAGRCWIRTFPLGGTHFTEAIANAFKLSYSKAEKLKLEASTSKYAKQIMQAMRPVFSDLLQDLQRSIGYYQSLHRESELKTMVGVGSTFKIPGLRKFLGQQLQIDVGRLDEYKRIAVTGREAASFAENAVNMATAYGLALQGVGMAPIAANLVPVKALRDQIWHSKIKWFAAAAAISIAGAGMLLYRPLTERRAMEPVVPSIVQDVTRRGDDLKRRFEEVKAKAVLGAEAQSMVGLLDDYRRIWPQLVVDAADALASAKPQPPLVGGQIEEIMKIDPQQRNLVQLVQLNGEYIPSAGSAAPAAAGEAGEGTAAAATQPGRRIAVEMQVQLSHANPDPFLTETVIKWLRDNADRPEAPYRIIPSTIKLDPSERQTSTVKSSGELEVVEAASAPPSAAGPAARSGPSKTRPPRDAIGSGSVGAGGTGLAAPAQNAGPPPGAGLGATGAGGSDENGGKRPTIGTNTPRTGPGTRPGMNRGGSSGSEDEAKELGTIDELAPVPNAPLIYPTDTKVYSVPIRFEIEIKDPKPQAAPDQAADASSNGEAAAT